MSGDKRKLLTEISNSFIECAEKISEFDDEFGDSSSPDCDILGDLVRNWIRDAERLMSLLNFHGEYELSEVVRGKIKSMRYTWDIW